jgi:hypothetical protein
MAPDRATIKEVPATPASTQGFMIFLFFPSKRKYNHATIAEAVNQGKIKGISGTWRSWRLGVR